MCKCMLIYNCKGDKKRKEVKEMMTIATVAVTIVFGGMGMAVIAHAVKETIEEKMTDRRIRRYRTGR